VPASCTDWSVHRSQPTAPESSGGLSPGSTSTPAHIAIGGTPRAKCCATASCPSASSEIPSAPASRSSSYRAACRETATPTSGGSSDSVTSDATVRPTR
jgi:hypothetical protein